MGLGITVTRKKGKETGYCYGCGADLVKEGMAGQMSMAEKKVGYWADQRNMLKKAQIKNWALCPRCRELNKLQKESDGVIPMAASEMLGPDPKMMAVFRSEVSQIRQQEKAVVVLCVDAVNISGTLIRTIRNYVGGNPILLAVTRCDLLPDYVFEDKSLDELKQIYAERCKDIVPAAVYLCSEDPVKMHQIGGIKELAADLWTNLNGRDPYIIGAANIGKSTLTDILIAGFVNRGLRLEHFRDRLSQRRVEKLKESRVTKSALPGTTLQNIRVPCFSDHKQALWDTPGLLLDESLAHFPIRNFRLIRAQRPTQIQPHVHSVDKKSLALLILEKNDNLPLLRIEVRTKKGASVSDEPIHLVWNSILDLDTRIVDIDQAHQAEKERAQHELAGSDQRQEPFQRQDATEHRKPLTAAERKLRKEQKRREYEERVQQEQQELGKAEWHRRKAQKRAEALEHQRTKLLSRLVQVNSVIVEANMGMDIAIANFGWLGLVSRNTCLVQTFAPKTGVRVVSHAALALPPSVGSYEIPKALDDDEREDDDDDMDMDMDDMDFGLDEDYDEFGVDEYGDYDDFMFQDGGGLSGDDEPEMDGRKQRWYQREKYVADQESEEKDAWARWSGKYVGWEFDSGPRLTEGRKVRRWVRDLTISTATRLE
jgi:50S ribosome-binding GTPase